MKNRNLDALLGIVFFGALIGLGIVTIVLSDFAVGVERHDLVFYSEDVGYLRAGDPVMLHGMASGKITSIERLDEELTVKRPHDVGGESPGDALCLVKVNARLDVDPFLHLKEDYHIVIQDLGVLGGKMVRIEVGKEDVFVPRDQLLFGDAPPSALQAMGQVIEENRAAVRDTIQDIQEFAEKANAGEGTLGLLMNDGGTRERIDGIIEDLGSIGDSLTEGDGTLAKLLNDSGPFDDLKAAAADVRGFTDDIRRGEGTVGKFLQDDSVYQEVEQLVADAREGLAPVWDGQGTLGKLITDDELYAKAESFMDDLLEIAEKVSNGEGTIARLLNDPQLYDDVTAFVADARALSHDLREGEGLVAALINDEKLLDDFRSILNQVLGAIEDARETTPVTSLGSFLFGTF